MVNIRLILKACNNYLPNYYSLDINDKQDARNYILEKIKFSIENLEEIAINQAKNYKGQHLFRDKYFVKYNNLNICHINIMISAEQISIQKKHTVFITNKKIKSINTNGIIDDLPYECQSCNEDDDTSDKFSNRRKSF